MSHKNDGSNLLDGGASQQGGGGQIKGGAGVGASPLPRGGMRSRKNDHQR